MLYFQIVAVAVAAAAAALTVLACLREYGLFVRSIRTVSCHRAIDCLCFVFIMNDVNFGVDRKIKIYSYNNTVNRTTQYNLYVFLNCDEQFLKKNKEKRKIQKLVRKNAFLKKKKKRLHRPQKAPYGTVLVWCLYGGGAVLVRCVFGDLGLK